MSIGETSNISPQNSPSSQGTASSQKGAILGRACYCVAVPTKIAAALSNRPTTFAVSGLGYLATAGLAKLFWGIRKTAEVINGAEGIQKAVVVQSDIAQEVIQQSQSVSNVGHNLANMAVGAVPFASTALAAEKMAEDKVRYATSGVLHKTFAVVSAIMPGVLTAIGKFAGYAGSGLDSVSSRLKYTTLNPGVVNEAIQDLADRSESVAFKMMYLGQDIPELKSKLSQKSVIDLSKVVVTEEEIEEFCSLPLEKLQDRLDIVASSKSLGVKWRDYKSFLKLTEKIHEYRNSDDRRKIQSIEVRTKEIRAQIESDGPSEALEAEILKLRNNQLKVGGRIKNTLSHLEKKELLRLIKLYKANNDTQIPLTFNDFKTLDFQERLRIMKMARKFAVGVSQEERRSFERLRYVSNEEEWFLQFPKEEDRERVARASVIQFNKLSDKEKERTNDIKVAQINQMPITDRLNLYGLVCSCLRGRIEELERSLSSNDAMIDGDEGYRVGFFTENLNEQEKQSILEKNNEIQSELAHLKKGLKRLVEISEEGSDLFLENHDHMRVLKEVINAHIPSQEKYQIQALLKQSISLFVFETEEDIIREIQRVKSDIEKSSNEEEKQKLASYLEGLEKAHDTQKGVRFEASYNVEDNTIVLSNDGLPLYTAQLPSLSIDEILKKIGSGVVSLGFWFESGKILGKAGGTLIQGAGYIPWSIFTVAGKASNPTLIKGVFNLGSFVLPFATPYITSPTAIALEKIGVPVRAVENYAIEMTKATMSVASSCLQWGASIAEKGAESLERVSQTMEKISQTKELDQLSKKMPEFAESAVGKISQYCSAQTGVNEICKEITNLSPQQLADGMKGIVQDSGHDQGVINIIKLLAPKSTEVPTGSWLLSFFKDVPQYTQLNEMVSNSAVAGGLQSLADNTARLLFLQGQLKNSTETAKTLGLFTSVFESVAHSLGPERVETFNQAVSALHKGLSFVKLQAQLVDKAQQAASLTLDLAYVPGMVHDAAHQGGEMAGAAIQRAEQYLIGKESSFSAGAKLFLSYGLPMLSATLLAGSGGFVVLPYLIKNIAPRFLNATGSYLAENTRPFWYGLAQGSLDMAGKLGEVVKEGGENLGVSIQSYMNRGKYIDPLRIDNFKELSLKEQNHVVDLVMASEYMNSSGNNDMKDELSREWESFKNKQVLDAGVEDEFIKRVLIAFDHLRSYELLAVSETYFKSLDRNIQERIRNVVKSELGLKKSDYSNIELIVARFNSLPVEKKRLIDFMPVYEYHALDIEMQHEVRFMIIQSKAYQDLLKSEGRKVPLSFEELWDEYKGSKTWNNERLKKILPLYTTMEDQDRNAQTPARLLKMPVDRILNASELVERYGLHKTGEVFTETKRKALEKILLKEKSGKRLTQAERKTKIDCVELLAAAFRQMHPHQQGYLLNLTLRELNGKDNKFLKDLTAFLMAQLPEKREELNNIIIECSKADTPVSESSREKLRTLFEGLPSNAKDEFQSRTDINQSERDILIQSFEKEVNKFDAEQAFTIKRYNKVAKEIKIIQDSLEVLKSKRSAQARTNELSPSSDIKKELDEIDENIKSHEINLKAKIQLAEDYEKQISERAEAREYFAKVLTEEGVEVKPGPTIANIRKLSEAEEKAIDVALQIAMDTLFTAQVQALKDKTDLLKLDSAYAHTQEVLSLTIRQYEKKIEEIQQKNSEIALETDNQKAQLKYELLYQQQRIIPICEMAIQKTKDIASRVESEYQALKKELATKTQPQKPSPQKPKTFGFKVRMFFSRVGSAFKRFGNWFTGLFRRNKPKA